MQTTDGRMADFYTSFQKQKMNQGFSRGNNYEKLYQDNWIAGASVDIIANDMTKAGVTIIGNITDEESNKIQRYLSKKKVWADITDAIRWARLFGVVYAVIEIEGQDFSSPLVKAGGYSCLKIYRAKDVEKSNEVLTAGRNIGEPVYYQIAGRKIHHSRVMKFYGVKNLDGTGESVLRRIYQDIIRLDGVLKACGLLVEKARLSIHKIDGLHEAVRSNNADYIIQQASVIAQTQDISNTTVIDSKDDISDLQYSFGGLPQLVVSFEEQVSGAIGIPLIRLFGQAPSGFGSTGETDLKVYADFIYSLQENDLRDNLQLVLELVSIGAIGRYEPSLDFEFNTISKRDKMQDADIVVKQTGAIMQAYDGGLLDDATALLELKALGEFGCFSNISNDLIDDKKLGATIDKQLDNEGGF
jgi:phage-related protein (TIGR01555 family)